MFVRVQAIQLAGDIIKREELHWDLGRGATKDTHNF